MAKQKRSENTYMKINTIFKRDVNNIIMPYDGYTKLELEWCKDLKFEATEKVDGTNMRIEVTPILDESKLTFALSIKGKTDNANIPKNLKEFMEEKYTLDTILNALQYTKSVYDIVNGLDELKTDHPGFFDKETGEFCSTRIPKMYTLYGEGYGAKIQACGSRYLKDSANFIGFDVKITSTDGKETYLLYNDKKLIFDTLNTDTVPIIGYFTIEEAIEYVKKGFDVTIPHDDPTFKAEGLVLRSPVGMKFRDGSECIFKIKAKDFTQYFNKYGTYDMVDQVVNSHI